ncbi:MAG: pyrimidine-nucleoside phosphorylase [Thermodesulfovibrionia bacterium]
MRAYDIIKKKRDGYSLSKDEMEFLLKGYLMGEVPDYQVSAFLMSVFFKGMDNGEVRNLTEIMLHSGKILDLSDIPGKKIDKHSTGGVGDKVSIILTPLMASAGLIVPMMTGRGLGHTGGTMDKLESIPGFRTTLNIDEIREGLRRVGCVMVGFSNEIAPLDRMLYTLRDVTATVDSIPLITASIMSKKLAEGIDGIVLDVKVGSGAFMKRLDDARRLAQSMVDIGNSMGVRTIAVITDMDEPLGMAVGNALEVNECIDVLQGKEIKDLLDVTLYLGAMMLKLAGMEGDIDTAIQRLRGLIRDGSALKRFKEMVEFQGGNPQIVERRTLLPHSCLSLEITSEKEGYIDSIDAEAVGIASMILGAGRERMDSEIDHSAGIVLEKKVGDLVRKGDTLCTFCTSYEDAIIKAKRIFLDGIEISDTPPQERRMIIEVIE